MSGNYQQMPSMTMEGVQTSIPMMPADAFRHHLDALASEHVRLEEENRQLRSLLLSVPPEAEMKAHYDVDSWMPPRVLEADVLHASAPPSPRGPPPAPEVQGLRVAAKEVNPEVCEAELEIAGNWKDEPFSPNAAHSDRLSDDFDSAHSPKGDHNPFIQVDSWKRKPIFANADDMKERVRQQLIRHHYKEQQFYKEDGWAQVVARHQVFEYSTYLVIALNAAWIGFDTDYNHEDLLIRAPIGIQVAENLFCGYFCFEITVRFVALSDRWKALRDLWFVFDFCLVLLMVLETWIMSFVLLVSTSGAQTTQLGDASVLRIARLIRLTRMARMARLLRAMPELAILLKGIAAAARSVFFTLVLLCILLYVFGIACTQLLRNTDVGDTLFKTVLNSMHTLWLRGTLLDEISEVMYEVEKVSTLCTVLLDLFILAAAMTVMNLLVGVLCEVVSVVSTAEKEEMNMSFVISRLERIFTTLGLDEDKNGMISKEEFVKILENRDAALAIQDLGVDVVGLVDFADVFFATDSLDDEYEKELSFAEFMEAVVALKGSNKATVKDIYDVRKVILQSMAKNNKQVDWVTANMFGDSSGTIEDMRRSCTGLRPSAKGARNSSSSNSGGNGGSTTENSRQDAHERHLRKCSKLFKSESDTCLTLGSEDLFRRKQLEIEKMRCAGCGKISL